MSLYVLNLVLGLMGLNVAAQRYSADVGVPDQHVYKVYYPLYNLLSSYSYPDILFQKLLLLFYAILLFYSLLR